jgi:hypothetical protein
MTDTANARPVLERIMDTLREMGTLIIVFSQLDALQEPIGSYASEAALRASAIGLLLYVLGLLIEARRAK